MEADDIQVAQLSKHPGIERVTKLTLPPAPTATTTTGTTCQPENASPNLARRQDLTQEWIVVPTDATNEAQFKQTYLYLKSLTNTEPKQYFQKHGKEFWLWLVNMTNAQRDEAVKNPGIKGVGLNSRFGSGSVTSLAAVPPPEAKGDIS